MTPQAPSWLAGVLRPQAAPHPGRIAVACSGGGDSVALLYGMVASGWTADALIVLHVDHAVRDDSGADADFVDAHAARLGLRSLRERLIWASMPSADDLRRERRAALSRMASQSDAGVIALAHTADDQRETKWLALARGSGLDGLVGMHSWRPPWWRPLLGLPRAALRDWLRLARIEWRDDPANTDTAHPRARLRHVLLPALGRPLGAGDVLRDRILHDDAALLAHLGDQARTDAVDGFGVLQRRRFVDLAPALQRRVLRSWLLKPSAERVEAVREALIAGHDSRLGRIEVGRGGHVFSGVEIATTDLALPLQTPDVWTNADRVWGGLGRLRIEGTAEVGPLDAWRRRSSPGVATANQTLLDAGLSAPLRAVWPAVRSGQTLWVPRPGSAAETVGVKLAEGAAQWTPIYDALR